MQIFIIALFSALAGLIQTVTGFGSGIVMMVVFPLFFSVLEASAVNSTISLVLTAGLSWRYRKSIDYRLTILPAVFYLIASTVSVSFAPYIPTAILIRVLGAFLVLLAIYFLAFPNKMELPPSLLSASICAVLSGISGGLFGIGGPPMVIYFLGATKGDKEKYLGTIQFFFLITGLYTCGLRVVRGIYTVQMLPYSLLGMAAILAGKAVGDRIVDRIDGEKMKKLIYIFLGISGLLNLFS